MDQSGEKCKRILRYGLICKFGRINFNVWLHLYIKTWPGGICLTLEAWKTERVLEAVGDYQETIQWRYKFSQEMKIV